MPGRGRPSKSKGRKPSPSRLCKACRDGATRSEGGANVADLNKMGKNIRKKKTRKSKVAALKTSGKCGTACKKHIKKTKKTKRSTKKTKKTKKSKKGTKRAKRS